MNDLQLDTAVCNIARRLDPIRDWKLVVCGLERNRQIDTAPAENLPKLQPDA